MNKETVRSRIEQIGIIPAIRVASAEDAIFAIEAVADSGIPAAEVTMTIPGAVRVIQELARKFSDLIVGGGSILDVETAQRCLDAGARFLTSPGLDRAVVQFGLERNTVVIPGALTPTEIMDAWKAGSDFVKIFPCSTVGGPSYIRALKAPFPEIPFIAAGGVTLQSAPDYILAGARAVGVGRDLITREAVERRQRDWIAEMARRYLRTTAEVRSRMHS